MSGLLLGLALHAHAAVDERFYNTFYLEGDRESYVLTMAADNSVSVRGPDGRVTRATVNATRKEFGLIGEGGGNRHFKYGLDGDDLLLLASDKDTPGTDSPLGKLPPQREGALAKFLCKGNWLKLHPAPAVVPGVAPEGADAAFPFGSWRLLDLAGRTFTLTLKEDKRFTSTGLDGRTAGGIYTWANGELSLYSASHQRLLFATKVEGALQLIRRDADAPKVGDVLGEMPPQGTSAVTWLRPTGALPGRAVPGVPTATGMAALREIERTRGLATAQAEAQYRMYMAAGDNELMQSRYDEARKYYDAALRFQPGNADTRERLSECTGRAFLTSGDQYRARGDNAQARTNYTAAVTAWDGLRGEVDQRLRILSGGSGVPNEVSVPITKWPDLNPRPATGDSNNEQQVLDLVRAGRTTDALATAVALQRANPNSLNASRLIQAVEQLRQADQLSSSLLALLGRARVGAGEAQALDGRDPSATRVLEVAAREEPNVKQAAATARTRLLERDYAGIGTVLADSKTSARNVGDACNATGGAYEERATKEEEFKGVKIGDLKIIGIDNATKKSRKWTDLATRFRALAKEAGDLAR